MSFFRQYSLIIGSALLIGVIALLLTPSDLMFSSGVQFIDTDLNRSTGNELYVQTKMDLGSKEDIAAFPMAIGNWTGRDEDTQDVETMLGADVMILRMYSARNVFQPLALAIMQSKTESSFHPPDICYPAAGYKIQEQGSRKVAVSDPSWTETSSKASIPYRMMVVTRESNGVTVERRVVLYFYLKGNQFTSNTVTMVRVEGLAPIEGSYEGILGLEETFMAMAFPYLFQPDKDKGSESMAAGMADWGVVGYFLIALMLAIPAAIIVYPKTPWGREDQRPEVEDQASDL